MEMERRKEELEKKRQKLAELRRAREERKQVFTTATQKQEEKSVERSRKEQIDDLVKSLLKDKATGDHPGTPTSSKSDDVEPEKGITSHHARLSSISTGYSPGTSVPQSPSILAPSRYIPDFSSFEAVILDIAPKELILYSKEVQTTERSFGPPPPNEDEIRAKFLKEQEEKEKARQAALEEERSRLEDEKKKMQQLKDISEDVRKKIISSNEFVEFIDHSTKIVERVLNENYDYMKDYSIIKDNENDDQSGSRVKYVNSFFDDRWTKNRSVTDVNWSRKNPEICVASYNKNPMAMNEPDGVAVVWSLKLLERPEYVFHSQSDVLTTMFSEFHPTLVIGGTYSGQIVLWDMRSKSLPVLKTPLSASGHTHPVYSMQMVGTQNAHNLITASTDGLICSWQLDMLAQPQETLELVHAEHSKTDEVSVTALGFPENETAAFWVGTEEGIAYQANRYGRAGGKAGINPYDVYKGHWGPITGLHFHPMTGQHNFSDLFLTSSVDWTCKLWRAKSISKPSTSPQTITPLYSFEGADDYVYDVKWSPTHPALFASVDGTGKFSLWNLNVDTEVPIVSTQVGSQAKALNKINWDKEGRKTAIGSSDGRVHIYDIGELANPRDDEWEILHKTISEMTTENHNGRYVVAK
ncbi:WD40 repeat-like protein [Rhizophagus irregularis]|uniref:Cytoplasmic dynein intermediate chain n=4 Tax=Rhizophagus irregularis TaxID=588596 RepID=U9T7Q6_RHIID|nr:cytoplasmic dynein intermediate chain [Rhizophagus irregularis DAOM 181602=DAOM 197198]EXX59024.1 dynein intermediate chain [Rhizophagus irregularis DAOM 197198w]PKC08735.1 WD40 repeat-like protein [Rhizophagus irregularis]PKC63879.1 WD40 repeat-like protein [Rhizophagus irregularis]PKY23606.1 WD40 repeat-like protein [Rhizophagus irregularis]POG63196.1 cytoplasmic dynein intermediate chain [Rhizophagus irregularis DAOM 181602=DAOM 197198]|eukprot:XP_025170062.1 cytoplasmic dynein intermediate chain [Rhizophagus irregularis DAOM 181602=DAOM 197198]